MKKLTTGCYQNSPYERTKTGLCYRAYYSQIANSKTRGHLPPNYTKTELATWILSQSNFEELYNNWIDSNYSTDYRPFVDRLDNSKGYSFDNIQLVTFLENKLNANRDTKNCTLGSSQVEIYQYNTNGTFKQKYQSMSIAARSEPNFDQRNISACCRNLIPTAYGYYWSYTYLGPNIPPIKTNVDYLTTTIYRYDPVTGDIIGVYDGIEEIATTTNKQINLRTAIRNNKIFMGTYYSFDYLSPDQVLDQITTTLVRPINKLDKNNNILSTYDSIKKAHQEVGTGAKQIRNACNNNTLCKGFYWEYAPWPDPPFN